MKRRDLGVISIGALIAGLLMPTIVLAHCQIPCGIYDDATRFTLLEEHVTTIEKSTNEIIRLSKEKTPDWNQLVRWVENKDKHADELSEIVSAYFMAQRIKPADTKDTEAHIAYMKQLSRLHEMLIYAMKAKQTLELENVKKLRSLIAEFKDDYNKAMGR